VKGKGFEQAQLS